MRIIFSLLLLGVLLAINVGALSSQTQGTGQGISGQQQSISQQGLQGQQQSGSRITRHQQTQGLSGQQQGIGQQGLQQEKLGSRITREDQPRVGDLDREKRYTQTQGLGSVQGIGQGLHGPKPVSRITRDEPPKVGDMDRDKRHQQSQGLIGAQQGLGQQGLQGQQGIQGQHPDSQKVVFFLKIFLKMLDFTNLLTERKKPTILEISRTCLTFSKYFQNFFYFQHILRQLFGSHPQNQLKM